MRHIRSPFSGILSLFLLVLSSSTPVSAQFSKSLSNQRHFAARRDTSPETVIKAFYKWYITVVETGTDPFKKGRPTLQKYVTVRLIRQIEHAESDGSDADAFLQTREWDKAWADTATVSNVRVKGATATAIVTFDAATNYPRVSVTLVKDAGKWKIDKVKNDPLPMKPGN